MNRHTRLAARLRSCLPVVATLALSSLSATSRADQPPAPAPPAASPAASTPTTAPATEPATIPLESQPLAGYQGGSFFLRDKNSWFVLIPKGRLHVDGYVFGSRGDVNVLDPGVDANSAKDPRPKDTIFVRRARIELLGTFARHIDFSIAGEFATVPGTGQFGSITDTYLIADYTPWARLQVGQFDVPFTMENRTSDKSIDFMERSLVVRGFAVPANKDIGAMVFGYAPNKVVYYSAGVFNGDGQSFKNQDNWPAVIGRAFVAPIAFLSKRGPNRRWMEELEVGGSFWWQRNLNIGETSGVAGSTSGATQNDLAGMSTQGGYSFFSSNYGNGKDAMGSAIRSHLVPNGDTVKWALEAHLPFRRYGLKWEYAHQDISLGQWNDTSATRGPPATRGGKLSGYGTYVEFYAWVLGGRETLEPPGIEAAQRIDFAKQTVAPTWGLQLLAKWDHVEYDISGLPMGGAMGTTPDPAQGHYAIDAVEGGANAWLTKHVRLSVNYVANFIGGFAHGANDAANLKSNYFYKTNSVDHEILFRAAVGL